MTRLRIATRKSALALWQSEHVANRLRAIHPGLEIELVPLTTLGDRILDRPLAEVGGKGLFLKELEAALLERAADCAVHSLKDVPMELEEPFDLAAILERANPFDALVSRRFASLTALPSGARIGTSSLRRQAQLRAHRTDLQPVDLRGNINTRLAKLDSGDFDAIILACAGLQRLGLDHCIRSVLAAPDWLPAVGQGAIVVECRAGDNDTRAMLAPLEHPPTRACVTAERAMNRRLHGSCQVPVAGYASLDGDRLYLAALVGEAATGECVRAEAEDAASEPEALGEQVAAMLVEQGAMRLLNYR